MAECIAHDALTNPEQAPLPNPKQPDEAVAVVWALMDALAEHAEDRLAAAILYVQRLPIDSQTAWASGLLNDAGIVRSPEAVARVLRSRSFPLFQAFVRNHPQEMQAAYGDNLMLGSDGKPDVAYVLRQFYPPSAMAVRADVLGDHVACQNTQFEEIYIGVLAGAATAFLPETRLDQDAFVRFLDSKAAAAVIDGRDDEVHCCLVAVRRIGAWAVERLVDRLSIRLSLEGDSVRRSAMARAVGQMQFDLRTSAPKK